MHKLNRLFSLLSILLVLSGCREDANTNVDIDRTADNVSLSFDETVLPITYQMNLDRSASPYRLDVSVVASQNTCERHVELDAEQMAAFDRALDALEVEKRTFDTRLCKIKQSPILIAGEDGPAVVMDEDCSLRGEVVIRVAGDDPFSKTPGPDLVEACKAELRP